MKRGGTRAAVIMDLMALRDIVLVVAIFIFLWAAVETSLRIWRWRQQKAAMRGNWVKLDPASPLAHQPDDNDDQEEQPPEQDLHHRAQQNGHHSFESRKRH